jgi:DNA repair ATPase RecN
MSEIKNIAEALKRKQDLIKDYKDQNEKANEIKAQIKELQEELKALFAVDEEIASLQDDVKHLSRELKQAAKAIAKDKSFKPAIVVDYAKKSVKGEVEVEKVKIKGNAFAFLEEEGV